MAQVHCKLPNASGKINGVAFVSAKGGMISEQIDDATAAELCKIPGFTLVAKGSVTAKSATDSAPAQAEPAQAQAETGQPGAAQ